MITFADVTVQHALNILARCKPGTRLAVACHYVAYGSAVGEVRDHNADLQLVANAVNARG